MFYPHRLQVIHLTDLSVCYGSCGLSIGFSVKGTVWPDLNRLEVVRLDSPCLVGTRIAVGLSIFNFSEEIF